MYTNYDGKYLGDSSMDPLFEELNRRKATVFVHPTAPVPEAKMPGVSSPVIEYPFDSTRAITNMLFAQARKRFPDVKMIFSTAVVRSHFSPAVSRFRPHSPFTAAGTTTNRLKF